MQRLLFSPLSASLCTLSSALSFLVAVVASHFTTHYSWFATQHRFCIANFATRNNSTTESATRKWGSARQPGRVRFRHLSLKSRSGKSPSRDYAIIMKSRYLQFGRDDPESSWRFIFLSGTSPLHCAMKVL